MRFRRNWITNGLAYRKGGLTHSSHVRKESLRNNIFLFFGENSSTNPLAKADVQLSLVEVAAKADLCL